MMPKQDGLLQNQLEALEAGKSLDSVLGEIPEESRELVPLIRLASSMRERVIPEPQFSETLVSDVCASMRTEQARKRKEERRSFWRDMFKPLLSPSTGRLVGVTLAAVLLVVSILGFGFWFGPTREARTVTLIEVDGLVEIATGEMGEDWEEVADGQQIKKGVRIRTGGDGTVTLLFYEGSRALVGPETDLFLTTVKGDGVEELTVAMEQRSGETSHLVVPLSGDKSAYQVHTASGTANVHGTTFGVLVPDEDITRFSVDTGSILVQGTNDEVTLNAGQATIAQVGEALLPPAYQFSLAGILGEGDLGHWVVEGVAFEVSAQTILQGNPDKGDLVRVYGRVLEDSTWIADIVKTTNNPQSISSFAGIVEAKGSEWTISAMRVIVDADSRMDPDLEIGDPIMVQFIVLDDGRWKAISGISLKENPLVTPAVQKSDDVSDPTETSEPTPLVPTDSPEPTDTPETEDTATPAPENIVDPGDDPDSGDDGDDQGDDDDDDQGDDDDDQGDDDDDQGNDHNDEQDNENNDDQGNDDDDDDDDDDDKDKDKDKDKD